MSDIQQPTYIQGKVRDFYLRHFLKADGRDLYLYGYGAHTGSALPEFQDTVATGSILRHDPLRDAWAIYSPHRQARTFHPDASADPLSPARPGALTEIPFADFELAIFGNRFPSLHPEAPDPSGAAWTEDKAKGACEVIVYTPAPAGSLATLSQAQRLLLLEAIIHRYAAHFANGAAYVLPFENRGDVVGVTLSHPHGQLYAFPFVPEPQAKAARAFAAGYNLSAERARWGADFAVASAQGVSAFCPPFARFPYEVWIAPDQVRPGPWAMTKGELEGLAALLGEIVGRYDGLFGEPMPYMLSFQAAPREDKGTYHFTAQFYPLLRDKARVKYLATVEQATGVFTVDVVPERAAVLLRGVAL